MSAELLLEKVALILGFVSPGRMTDSPLMIRLRGEKKNKTIKATSRDCLVHTGNLINVELTG